MAFQHGKNAVFYLGNYTGTLTSITIYGDSIDVPFTVDVAETTTFGSVQKTYVAGIKDGTISIEGPRETSVEAILWAALGVSKEYEYGPDGSASGSIMWHGSAICTNFNPSSSNSAANRWSASFQQNGTASYTSFS